MYIGPWQDYSLLTKDRRGFRESQVCNDGNKDLMSELHKKFEDVLSSKLNSKQIEEVKSKLFPMIEAVSVSNAPYAKEQSNTKKISLPVISKPSPQILDIYRKGFSRTLQNQPQSIIRKYDENHSNERTNGNSYYSPRVRIADANNSHDRCTSIDKGARGSVNESNSTSNQRRMPNKNTSAAISADSTKKFTHTVDIEPTIESPAYGNNNLAPKKPNYYLVPDDDRLSSIGSKYNVMGTSSYNAVVANHILKHVHNQRKVLCPANPSVRMFWNWKKKNTSKAEMERNARLEGIQKMKANYTTIIEAEELNNVAKRPNRNTICKAAQDTKKQMTEELIFPLPNPSSNYLPSRNGLMTPGTQTFHNRIRHIELTSGVLNKVSKYFRDISTPFRDQRAETPGVRAWDTFTENGPESGKCTINQDLHFVVEKPACNTRTTSNKNKDLNSTNLKQEKISKGAGGVGIIACMGNDPSSFEYSKFELSDSFIEEGEQITEVYSMIPCSDSIGNEQQMTSEHLSFPRIESGTSMSRQSEESDFNVDALLDWSESLDIEKDFQ